jgi:hypothetical protein
MKNLLLTLIALVSISAHADCDLHSVIANMENAQPHTQVVESVKITIRDDGFKFVEANDWSNETGGTVKFSHNRSMTQTMFVACIPGEFCMPQTVTYEGHLILSLTYGADCKADQKLTTWTKVGERVYYGEDKPSHNRKNK